MLISVSINIWRINLNFDKGKSILITVFLFLWLNGLQEISQIFPLFKILYIFVAHDQQYTYMALAK